MNFSNTYSHSRVIMSCFLFVILKEVSQAKVWPEIFSAVQVKLSRLVNEITTFL